MAKCKACGAEIIWIKTQSGKNMPCDKKPVMYWKKQGTKGKVVTKNGEVVTCEFEGNPSESTRIGYMPHWSTCPSANKFRNKKESPYSNHHEIIRTREI